MTHPRHRHDLPRRDPARNDRPDGGLTRHERALRRVHLGPLMARSRGDRRVSIGLIDGPVASDRPELAESAIRGVPPSWDAGCRRSEGILCEHGTFVARMLVGGGAPRALCPACTLRVRPIFRAAGGGSRAAMEAAPEELATALHECLAAGVDVVNLSLALARPSTRGYPPLAEALDLALRRGVPVVASAGNQGTLGSTAILRHPAVIPVAACDLRGRPLALSNLGRSIALRGLSAPGEVEDPSDPARPKVRRGTSIAVPFVAGAVALLRSLFPRVSAATVRGALLETAIRRPGVAPPLLDAWGAHEALANGTLDRRKIR